MKISVIVPVYNAEAYLERLIMSFKRQTFTDFEVIFVDNASTDNSKNYLKQYVGENVLLLEELKQGVNLARKLGFQHARGDYVYFVDADDYLKDNTLERFAKTIEETHADYIISDYVYEHDGVCNYQKGFTKLSSSQWILDKELFISASHALWNKVIKRECISENDFCDSSYAEDFSLGMKVLQTVNSIYYISEPLYCYQKNMGSLSNRNLEDISIYYHILFSMMKIYDDYEDHPLQEVSDYLIVSHMFRHLIKASMIRNQVIRMDLVSHYYELIESIDYQENEYFQKDMLLRLLELVSMKPRIYQLLCSNLFQTITPKGIKLYQKIKQR